MARATKSGPESIPPPSESSNAKNMVDAVRKIKFKNSDGTSSNFADAVALGDEPMDSEIKTWIDTRIATLNYAIARPGYPSGRLTVIIGNEGASKSTLAYHGLAEAQSMGGVAVLVDAERAFDVERAVRLGIDMDNLIIVKPRTVEKAFATIEKLLIEAKAHYPEVPMVIVVDSLTGLPSQGALDKEIGEASVALVSRAMSASILPRIIPLLADTSAALIIINQLRQHIDMNNMFSRAKERRKVMANKAMIAEGPLVYYASLVIHVATIGLVGEKDEPTGISVRAVIRKDRIGPGEGHSAEYNVDYLNGVDIDDAKLELLIKINMIKDGGGWYKLVYAPKEDKGFRRADWPEFLEAHPELEILIKEAPLLWKTG